MLRLCGRNGASSSKVGLGDHEYIGTKQLLGRTHDSWG